MFVSHVCIPCVYLLSCMLTCSAVNYRQVHPLTTSSHSFASFSLIGWTSSVQCWSCDRGDGTSFSSLVQGRLSWPVVMPSSDEGMEGSVVLTEDILLQRKQEVFLLYVSKHAEKWQNLYSTYNNMPAETLHTLYKVWLIFNYCSSQVQMSASRLFFLMSH